MDTLLHKRKCLEEISQGDSSSLKSIKNFLHRVVSPRKKRKLIHETENKETANNMTNNFITSSPKPKLSCKSPQKTFRAKFDTENVENILSSPPSRCISEPGSVKRALSFETATECDHAATAEILFSPAFHNKTSLRRSQTIIGCVSPHLADVSKALVPVPIPLQHIETSEDTESDNTTKLFSLRTDEQLDDDISDSDTLDLTENSRDEDIFQDYDFNLIGEISQEEPDPSQYDHDLDSLYFIKNVAPIPDSYKNRSPHLPPKRNDAPKITLVLDLDETLVHCETSTMEDPDYKFPVEFHGQLYEVWGRKRPFVDKFLRRVSQLFEVVVFTASQQVYAEYILEELDSNGVIDHKLFRDSCVHVNGNYLKDLTVLGRDLSQVVIIDNAITSFAYQVNNGIPIISWYEDTKDRELMDLLPFLEKLSQVDDVRPHLQSAFNIQAQIDSLKDM